MDLGRDDRSLLASWADGDAAAGQTLVERHFGAVYGFFRNKLAGDLDDIVQRTFLGCVGGLPTFRREASFRTFLFAVARNQLLMELRRRRTDRQVLVDEDTVFDLQGQDSSVPEASLALEGRREQVLLLRALRHLPIDDQLAIELFYWDELGTKEIAEVLDRPHATVRTRLRRARQRLHELIAELGQDARLVTSTADQFDDWVQALRARIGAAPMAAEASPG